MNRWWLIVAVVLFFSCAEENKETLYVGVAANVQFPMQEIIQAFEKKKPNINVEMITGSSGKLTSQIENGSPIDVFLSADLKYGNYLANKGLTVEKPTIYAYGQLILWSKKEGINAIQCLKDSLIHQIAIANQKNAPYGIAAMEVLQKLDAYQEIKEKLVYGESISQVNQYISLESVDLAITSKSVVNKLRSKGTWLPIPDSLYQPIKQGVVITKNKNALRSKAFTQFLLAKESQTIFTKYGYIAVE